MVNINPAYRTHELEYALKQSEVQTLILLIDRFKTSDYVRMFYEVCPEAKGRSLAMSPRRSFPFLKDLVFMGGSPARHVHLGGVPRGGGRLHTDDILLERAEVPLLRRPHQHPVHQRTTGFPKGVVLTHHSVLNNGYIIGECMKFSEKDRLCIPVPFYHCFGMVLSNMACCTHGATMVLPSRVLRSAAVLNTIEKERCTAVHGVPTMFIAELAHSDFNKFNLKSLRTGIMAGSPCPMEVMKKVNTLMNMTEVVIVYGQTETSPGITMSSTEDSRGAQGHHRRRAIPPYRGQDRRPKDGEDRPQGRNRRDLRPRLLRDEVLLQQPRGHPCNARQGSWNHTGDLATMDEEGYFKIVGRLKDMVIRGGENIYPREIEEFLYTTTIRLRTSTWSACRTSSTAKNSVHG